LHPLQFGYGFGSRINRQLRPDLSGQFKTNPAFLRSGALIVFGTENA